MKNKVKIIMFSCFFIFLFVFIFQLKTIKDIKTEKELLKKEIASLQVENKENKSGSGGAEVSIENDIVKASYFRFPIHESDFRYFTSPFGIRVSPFLNVEMKHNGVDIAATWRAQVVAIADGIVVEHYPVPGTIHPEGYVFKGHDVYGGMIKIDHGEGFESLYAHLSYSRVHTGKKVKAGEIIGRIGNTGKSVGEHLHFEIKKDGESVNPLLYIGDPRK